MELSHKDWLAKANALEIPTKAFIDGKHVDALSGKTFETINPATGDVLAHLPACDASDVDRAVASARAAFNDGRWSRKSPAERKAVILRLSALILEHQAELALLDSLDMGKPVRDAATIDVPGAAAIFQWYGEAIDKVYDEIAPTGSGDLAMIRREALGVVAAVVPWNFPLDMATWKCAPALAMGNSVVLKPAEQSPLSAVRLAELACEAGLPDGVLNVVTGYGETAGKAIGLHPDIDCIAFTGSTEVGKYFLTYSGQSNMKQVWLECGGKSPNLVFADCDDLDTAAEMAAVGIFFNQGEVCSANSRLLVEKSISADFIERVAQKAKGFVPGDPLDPASSMGAIVDEKQLLRIMEFIDQGRTTCDLICGGNRKTIDGKGFFVEPTIFANVAPDNKLATDEVFGPVLAVTTFDSEEEAVAIANDTVYGLAASIWTSNLSRAHRVSEKLQAGTVSVNAVDAISPMTPFGGFKQSGIGRDLSLHAFDKFSALKTTWIKY